MSAHPRPRANDLPNGGLRVLLWGTLADKVRASAKQAQCDPEDFAREAISEFMSEHRSGKPPLITNDDLDERNGSDWDGVCL